MRFSKSWLFITLIILVWLGPTPAVQGQSSWYDNIAMHDDLQIAGQIHLMVDGIATKPENMPLLLASGRTVISLQSLQTIIPCQSELGRDGEIIVLWEQSRIQLFPDKNEMLVNSIPRSLDMAPLITADGNCLLPLRPLAEVMGYTVLYDTSSQTIQLNSPGYQPPPQPAPQPIDYSTLPTWGSIFCVPGLVELWPNETIMAGYFTKLVNSSASRTNNILLAAAKINGKVLQADEIFSFNQTVGPRTAQGGYQNAKIFAGQKVVTGIGGGICQMSSTLYNVVLEAGLQVLERYPHSLKVVYAPPNRDATVSWGGADFKFRNTSGFPLKILCKVENGYVFAVFVKVPSEIMLYPDPQVR